MNKKAWKKLQVGLIDIRDTAMSSPNSDLPQHAQDAEISFKLGYITGLASSLLTIVDEIEVDDESPNHD